jgi:hypothetical protein
MPAKPIRGLSSPSLRLQERQERRTYPLCTPYLYPHLGTSARHPEPQPRLPMVSIEKPRLSMKDLLQQARADVAKERGRVPTSYLRWTKKGNCFAGIVLDCILGDGEGRYLFCYDENGTQKGTRLRG